MPEISRFFGIVIQMYWDDHNPPHFHAHYGDEHAVVDIQKLCIIGGKLSPRAMGLVTEWASLHQSELLDDWSRAQRQDSLLKIEPLR